MVDTSTCLTIIFPIFNEADQIKKSIELTEKKLKQSGIDSYEFIIAEDGSTDGSDAVSANLARQHTYIKHIHSDKRLGRGAALNCAIKQSNGRVIIYMDADLATDLNFLPKLYDYAQQYDIVTGSRLLQESDVKRRWSRAVLSISYNFMVRLILRSKLNDHQCGFKAFKRDSILAILNEVKDHHWFWDTELLIRAQNKGYKIKEMPVRWRYDYKTKVKVAKDVIYFILSVLRLRRNLAK